MSSLSLYKNNFIYLFLAMLDLCCCMGFSLVAVSGGYSLVVVCRLLIVVTCCGAQVLGSMGFSSCGSPTLEHRLSICGVWA